MKLLVTGSRDYADYNRLHLALTEVNPSCIIHGGAKGADSLAAHWGETRGLPVFECKANWNVYKKAAGPIRNGWMLKFMVPDLVLAFPLPDSVGTYHMIDIAEKAGIEVKVIDA